jgi:Ca2+-binding RTX toxin-like protein
VATNTGAAARDIYIGIDNLRGTAFDDHLIGDGTSNVLEGGAGHDVLDGKGGIDTASYEHSGAAVHVDLSPGGSIGGGDAEGDTLSSIENLRGSAFNDILRGDNGANIIEGGAGNDTLDGAGGNDTVSYEHATAGVKVDLSISSHAQNTVGAGLDTIANFENVTGSQFNDRLTGDSHDNTFMGLGGNDTFVFNFGSGHDTITDFRPGHDHIELDNLTSVPTDSFGNFTEAQFNTWKAMPGVFVRSGDDTLIHLDGSDTLLLKNVSPASLHANDFIVHPGTT